MTHSPETSAAQSLEKHAYQAFDRGDLQEASQLFSKLVEQEPTAAHFHYMLGLSHKYQMNWRESLRHNLRSQQLDDEFDARRAFDYPDTFINQGECIEFVLASN